MYSFFFLLLCTLSLNMTQEPIKAKWLSRRLATMCKKKSSLYLVIIDFFFQNQTVFKTTSCAIIIDRRKALKNDLGQAQVNKLENLLNKILSMNTDNKRPMIWMYGHCVHYLRKLLSLCPFKSLPLSSRKRCQLYDLIVFSFCQLSSELKISLISASIYHGDIKMVISDGLK